MSPRAAGATKKPKEVYRETYKHGSAMIREELLPERFPFTADGWRVDSIEVLAAGTMADGREFQEIKIYTREVPKPRACICDDCKARRGSSRGPRRGLWP